MIFEEEIDTAKQTFILLKSEMNRTHSTVVAAQCRLRLKLSALMIAHFHEDRRLLLWQPH